MSYPFVAAWYDDYGARKGPTLGLLYHMAEGGGTVGYLDKTGRPPSRGVSVHAVCDYGGVVTQMLKWTDASGSLNPADRSTDKAYYGHRHLHDVLGDWWIDPNSVTLSMEIEGFAAKGPNADQIIGAIAWGRDMIDHFPELCGALGHADQTDTKHCPGTTAAMQAIFAGVGGHGLWTPQEEPVPGLQFRFLDRVTGIATVQGAGHALIRVDTGEHVGVSDRQAREVAGRIVLTAPAPGTSPFPAGTKGYLVGNIPGLTPDQSIAAMLLEGDVLFTPDSAPASYPVTVGGKPVGEVTLP